MNPTTEKLMTLANEYANAGGVIESAQKQQALRLAIDAALSAPAGWQPIETAPKDGAEVLLSNGACVAEGHWLFREGSIRERRDIDGRYIDQDEDEGYEGWIDWAGGMLPEPTHWMPLPNPPAAPSPQEPQT